MPRFKSTAPKCFQWVAWCLDQGCGDIFDTGDPTVNYGDAVRHVVLTAHNVAWSAHETGLLTPEEVAAAR